VTKDLTTYLYIFYMLPMSQNCAQPFETNDLPCLVTRPDVAEGSLARACPPAHMPLTGPILNRNLKIYRYAYLSLAYTGIGFIYPLYSYR
jgi:hypothetical protein